MSPIDLYKELYSSNANILSTMLEHLKHNEQAVVFVNLMNPGYDNKIKVNDFMYRLFNNLLSDLTSDCNDIVQEYNEFCRSLYRNYTTSDASKVKPLVDFIEVHWNLIRGTDFLHHNNTIFNMHILNSSFVREIEHDTLNTFYDFAAYPAMTKLELYATSIYFIEKYIMHPVSIKQYFSYFPPDNYISDWIISLNDRYI